MTKRPIIGSAGELLVEFVATDKDGHHRRPTTYEGPFPSGAPGIFIDQAAKLGAKAAFVGAVGDDAFGDVLRQRFETDGVDLSLIGRVAGVPTGSAFVSYNTDGSRDFVFNIAHSAASRFEGSDTVANALIAIGLDAFHVSGSSLGDAAMAEKLMTLCRKLRAGGVPLSFDPNVRKELLGDPGYRRTVDELLELSSFILPSEEDTAVLFPGETFDSFAPRLIAGGAQVVALKRGADGARGLTRSGEAADLPAFAVPVVDPTGAGDCFCATLVTLLASEEFSFVDALRRANAAGALAVGKVGPMEGNSTRAEIDTFLKERH
jgi:sugar/nucleoside kinase (ribokinase family)